MFRSQPPRTGSPSRSIRCARRCAAARDGLGDRPGRRDHPAPPRLLRCRTSRRRRTPPGNSRTATRRRLPSTGPAARCSSTRRRMDVRRVIQTPGHDRRRRGARAHAAFICRRRPRAGKRLRRRAAQWLRASRSRCCTAHGGLSMAEAKRSRSAERRQAEEGTPRASAPETVRDAPDTRRRAGPIGAHVPHRPRRLLPARFRGRRDPTSRSMC